MTPFGLYLLAQGCWLCALTSILNHWAHQKEVYVLELLAVEFFTYGMLAYSLWIGGQL